MLLYVFNLRDILVLIYYHIECNKNDVNMILNKYTCVTQLKYKNYIFWNTYCNKI